jgi:hypothetical protein
MPTARELRAMAARRGVAPSQIAQDRRSPSEAPEIGSRPSAAPTRGNHGAPSPLILTLPLPPNLANARMHWRTKDRERRRYFADCDYRQALGVIHAPPAEPFAFAELWALIVSPRKMDADNRMARVKWCVDWFVTRGYLAGDSDDYVRWKGVPAQRVIDRRRYVGEPHVTFTIAPQAPAPGGGG